MCGNDILVSVVVITYNHEKYVRQALDSILSQKTNFKFEILVGDDCSNDSTPEILKQYQEKFPDTVHAFLREKNLGATRNLYETTRFCKGKYIASCEGDDFWTDENKLQCQIDFMESHSEYIGCVHPITVVDENGNKLKDNTLKWIDNSKSNVFSIKDYKGLYVPGHGVTMVKKNLFLEDGFSGDLIYKADRNIADRTIALLWLERGDFYVMDKPMASYRKVDYGDNLTSKLYRKNLNKIKMDYEYTLNLERYANEHNIDAGFEYHKKELFFKSIVWAVIHCNKENIKLPFLILKNAKNPIGYIFGIIPSAVNIIKRSI